jgi:shikimate dehydrogenase
MTRPYAEVIGDPIAHSKSPVIHGLWLAKLEIDAEYRACHVRPEELADYFAKRRADPAWMGCNVTLPHKQAVAAHLDLIDGKARDVGAINTVHWQRLPDSDRPGLIGFNTDVDGLREAIAVSGKPARKVVVIGAGGAARAAFSHFSGSRTPVHVIARNAGKAQAVLAEFSGIDVHLHAFSGAGAILRDADLVINASQLGMSGQPQMPSDIVDGIALTAPDALVFDMVYAPLNTALLARARDHGRMAVDGLTMLIGQADTAFIRFFGQPAPREHDAALRALLTQ